MAEHVETESSKTKESDRWTLRGISTIVLFFSVLSACFIYKYIQVTTPENSVAKYEKVLNKWQSRGIVDHFPTSIPSEATDVKLSAIEGFLKAGGHLKLRMKLSSEQIKKIYEEAGSKAKAQQAGGDRYSLTSETPGGLAGTSPHTLGEDVTEYPEHYKMFIFDAIPYKVKDGENNWGHGRSYGLLVSLEQNEVIYFADDW